MTLQLPNAEREAQVRSMFDRIAGRYDAMNSVMTAGLHHRWRRRAADLAALEPGGAALDVCCGTGDLALELSRRVGPQGRVVGVDFSEPMLELAREKSGRVAQPAVEYRWANALELPFSDGTFDAATVGFGVRNVVDLRRAIEEMERVVRPGGRVVILEITTPQRPPMSWFYRVWFDRIVPVLGAVGGERDAYTYLPSSVRRFPAARALAALMDDAGLRDIRYLLVAGGIVAIHCGTVAPGDAPSNGGSAQFEAVLAADGGRARSLMARAEELLSATAVGHGPEVGEPSVRTLAAGGKRLRPLLVFVCAGDAANDETVRAAAAAELVHMATLVHDDVLDGAPLRRGHATVFASAGRPAAVFTGDFLFSRAFSMLAQNGSPEQVQVLSDACLALARGELAQRDDAYRPDVSEERYLRRCELKTASLFSAACALGALAGQGGSAAAGPMREYGSRIGLAFQLLDDVLDVSGPPDRTGKARGTDLLDGTTTLPLILARAADSELAALDLRSLRSRADAEAVCDRIAATGALGDTRARASGLVAEAKASLAGLDDLRLRERLTQVADRVLERYS
jgi:ubiquinone/menaquinone biosynthesis methyltransferase